MAKLTNAALKSLVAAKLGCSEDNITDDRAVTLAKALDLIPETLHEVKVVHWDAKGKTELAAPTATSKCYLAITGGARGRDCWIPMPKGIKAHVKALAAEFAAFADSFTDDTDE